MEVKESSEFKKLKWVLQPRQSGYPTKRWGHTAVVHEGRLLIYGGNHTGVTYEGVYKIDCQSLDGGSIEYQGAPEIRQSHSCCLVRDSLYIFGGCINQESIQLTNQLLQLRLSEPHPTWRKLEQINPLPPRESHVSLAITNRYMLIYGGTTPSETMLDDYWLCDLQTATWQEVTNIQGKLQPKIGLSMTLIGRDIFVFGGQFGEEEESTVSNDVYRLHFENENLIYSPPPPLTITKLEIIGQRPQPRTGHCTVNFKGRMLIVMGGEGISFKQAPVLYNDIWTFDLKLFTWTELLVENRSSFRPRSNFTANLYKHTIYIFGGFTSLTNFKWTDELVTLTLHENRHHPNHHTPEVTNLVKTSSVCATCKFQFLPSTKQLDSSGFQRQVVSQQWLSCSMSNVVETGNLIVTPFEALGLLILVFSKFSGHKKHMCINMVTSPHPVAQNGRIQLQKEDHVSSAIWKKAYLSILVSGLSISKQFFQNLIYKYSLSELGYDFKNAGLRLGRLLLVCGLFEDDTIYCYLLSIRGINKFILNRHNMLIDLNENEECRVLNQFLQFYSIDPLSLIEGQYQIRVIAAEMNTKKNLLYEMVYTDNAEDLQMSVGNDKQTFSSFMREYFLQQVSITLSVNGNKIPLVPYEKLFKSISKQQQPNSPYFERMHLLVNEQSFNHATSPFVKLYAFNHRVAIFSKYPFIAGYIELNRDVPLSISRTRCESWQVREAIEKQIEIILAESRKRASEVSSVLLAQQIMEN